MEEFVAELLRKIAPDWKILELNSKQQWKSEKKKKRLKMA